MRLARPEELDTVARAALARYFRDDVLPALTPLAIDTSRPFPMLASLSLNLALLLAPAADEEEPRLAVVQVPGGLPRLFRAPGLEGMVHLLLEDVIRAELPALFPGQEILDVAVFRVARDAELDFDDEGGRDFLEQLEEELKNRRRSGVVRLEVESGVGERLLGLLVSRLEVQSQDVYRVRGPVDVRPLASLVDLPALEDLRDPPLRAAAGARAGGPATCSRCSTSATWCSTTPTSPSTRWWRSSPAPRTTPTCSPSSRRSTAPAATRRSCARWRAPPRTASR